MLPEFYVATESSLPIPFIKIIKINSFKNRSISWKNSYKPWTDGIEDSAMWADTKICSLEQFSDH